MINKEKPTWGIVELDVLFRTKLSDPLAGFNVNRAAIKAQCRRLNCP
jgi:hypothetical protein